MDEWGGLHPFGAAPRRSPTAGYWPGWNIAKDAIANPDRARRLGPRRLGRHARLRRGPQRHRLRLLERLGHRPRPDDRTTARTGSPATSSTAGAGSTPSTTPPRSPRPETWPAKTRPLPDAHAVVRPVPRLRPPGSCTRDSWKAARERPGSSWTGSPLSMKLRMDRARTPRPRSLIAFVVTALLAVTAAVASDRTCPAAGARRESHVGHGPEPDERRSAHALVQREARRPARPASSALEQRRARARADLHRRRAHTRACAATSRSCSR